MSHLVTVIVKESSLCYHNNTKQLGVISGMNKESDKISMFCIRRDYLL